MSDEGGNDKRGWRLNLGGMPTEMDVKKLLNAWPDIQAGQMIGYAEVEKVLALSRNENRFRGVTDAWRRTLERESNVFLKVLATIGFQRLSEAERSKHHARKWVGGLRLASREVRRQKCVNVAALDERTRGEHDHRLRVMAAHHEDASKSVRDMAPPKAPEQLPRAPMKG